MLTRSLRSAALAAVVLLMAAGCAPDPEPDEPEPLFTNEAEAFAAAEQTYRAYVDALNDRRSDPQADVDQRSFLVGSALESDLETARALSDSGLRLSGETSVMSVEGSSYSTDPGMVSIRVCLDSSATRVVDGAGVDQTPATRPALSELEIDLVVSGDDLLIATSSTRNLDGC